MLPDVFLCVFYQIVLIFALVLRKKCAQSVFQAAKPAYNRGYGLLAVEGSVVLRIVPEDGRCDFSTIRQKRNGKMQDASGSV